MRLVLDAGALIAIERNDRRVAAFVQLARRRGEALVTCAPVVGQVWRDGTKQALLARTLAMVDVRSVGLVDCQRAGELLGRSRTADIVDALLALIPENGDQVLTSDPSDIKRLLTARGADALIVSGLTAAT